MLLKLDTFISYLNNHLLDNGRDGTPRLQPIPRDQGLPPLEKVRSSSVTAFRHALANWVGDVYG